MADQPSQAVRPLTRQEAEHVRRWTGACANYLSRLRKHLLATGHDERHEFLRRTETLLHEINAYGDLCMYVGAEWNLSLQVHGGSLNEGPIPPPADPDLPKGWPYDGTPREGSLADGPRDASA